MSDVVCFSHAGCQDGFAASWVLKKAHPDANVVFVKYGGELPDISLYKGKRVYITDFSYEPELMRQIDEHAESVVMLDHHASAIEKWSGQEMKTYWNRSMVLFNTWGERTTIVFSDDKCGAAMTFEWLQDEKRDDVFDGFFWDNDEDDGKTRLPMPKLIAYVQDRDFWHWKLPNSKEVSAYMATVDMKMGAWDELQKAIESPLLFDEAVASGRAILKREKQIVDKHVRRAVMRKVAGYHVPVVNATELHSEIGHALCHGHPFAVMYFDDLELGKRIWSFRSDGNFDVKKIAMSFGGGGHCAASGCQSSLGTNIYS